MHRNLRGAVVDAHLSVAHPNPSPINSHGTEYALVSSSPGGGPASRPARAAKTCDAMPGWVRQRTRSAMGVCYENAVAPGPRKSGSRAGTGTPTSGRHARERETCTDDAELCRRECRTTFSCRRGERADPIMSFSAGGAECRPPYLWRHRVTAWRGQHSGELSRGTLAARFRGENAPEPASES